MPRNTKENGVKLIPIILVVYKSKNGLWRGFCNPYDVTCNSDTKEEAKQQLIKLVRLYEEGLQKYHNPRHLVFKELSSKEDDKLFRAVIWPRVSKEIQKKMFRSYLDYIKRQEIAEKSELTTHVNNTHQFISYSQRPFAFRD